MVPWATLAELIQPGPGHLVTILGAPGVGKSAFSLLWALRLGEPALVISQDTDLATQAQRTVATLAGVTMSEVKKDYEQWEKYLKASSKRLPMMVDYPVDALEVADLLVAAEEFYGTIPKLVVVDVLKDIIAEEGYEGHREALRELHRLARRFHTTVVVLHHVNRQGKNSDGTKPVRLSDGQYAGEQDSEIVLGLYMPKYIEYMGEYIAVDNTLRVSVLKNRFGRRDSTGESVYADLTFDYERMRISG